jgi:hypothetical protein
MQRTIFLRPSFLGLLGLVSGILVLIGGLWFHNEAQNYYQKVEDRLQAHKLTWNSRDYHWTWQGLEFNQFEIRGANLSLLIGRLQIQPHLRLNFQQPIGLAVVIDRLRINHRFTAEPASSANSQHSPANMGKAQGLTQRLNALLGLFEQVRIDSATATLFDDQGTPLYTAIEGTIHYSQTEGQLRYQLGQLRYRDKVFLENIQGSMITDSRGAYWPFLVANGPPAQRNWQAKGRLKRDLTQIHLFLKNFGLPREWSRTFARYLPNHRQLNYAIRIQLQKDQTNATIFDLQLGSTNFTLAHPNLASNAVGPIAFQTRFRGVLEDQTGKLKGRGLVRLIAQQNKQNKLQIQFRLQKRDILNQGSNDPWRFALGFKRTACADIQAILPRSILGDIKDFPVQGTTTLDLQGAFAVDSLADFDYQIQQAQYDCRLQPHLARYRRPFLRRQQPPDLTPDADRSPQFEAFLSSDYTTRLGPFLPLFFTAAEDTGFWSHPGIEFSSIEAALRQNLKAKRIVVGGSTITMQTAKNLYLNGQRTLARKFQEVILADYLERQLNKSQILEIYANIIEFGPGLYGIRRASRVFFGREPHQLNPVQALYLASILPNPQRYLINYCLGRLDQATVDRLRQVAERFNAIRPSKWPVMQMRPGQLQFSRHENYRRRYCPRTVAKYRKQPR